MLKKRKMFLFKRVLACVLTLTTVFNSTLVTNAETMTETEVETEVSLVNLDETETTSAEETLTPMQGTIHAPQYLATNAVVNNSDAPGTTIGTYTFAADADENKYYVELDDGRKLGANSWYYKVATGEMRSYSYTHGWNGSCDDSSLFQFILCENLTGIDEDGDTYSRYEERMKYVGICVDAPLHTTFVGYQSPTEGRIYDNNALLTKVLYYGYNGALDYEANGNVPKNFVFDINTPDNLAIKWARLYLSDYFSNEPDKITDEAVETVAYLLTHHTATWANDDASATDDWLRGYEDGTANGGESWLYEQNSNISGNVVQDVNNYINSDVYNATISYVDNMNTEFLANGKTLYSSVIPYIVAFRYEVGAMTLPNNIYSLLNRAYGEQDVATLIIGDEIPVRLNIKKSSADPTLVSNNACYDLTGAQYSLFETESAVRASFESVQTAKGNRSTAGAVATLTTNANGDTNILTNTDIDMSKTYYIVETVAPRGYALDNFYYEIDLNAKNGTFKRWIKLNGTYTTDNVTYNTIVDAANGDLITLPVSDTPLNDPVNIIIKKSDEQLETNLNGSSLADLVNPGLAQGEGTLGGAIYQLSYYDSYNTSDNVTYNKPTGNVKYNWYFKTDNNGKIYLTGWNENGQTADINNYFVASFNGNNSNNLFLDEFNRPVWPLGTYVIKEVQAPADYLVSDSEFVVAVIEDVNEPGGAKTAGDIGEITDAHTATGAIAAAERIKRYSLEMNKTDYDTQNYSSQGNGELPTKFIVMNNSEKDMLYDINGDGTYDKTTELISTINLPMPDMDNQGGSNTNINNVTIDDIIYTEINKCDDTSINNIDIDINNDGINDVISVLTVDANGKAKLDGLTAGVYRVYEYHTDAYRGEGDYDESPKDFIVNSTTVDANGIASSKINNQIHRAGVQVLKLDALTSDGAPTEGLDLADIEFTITNLSDKSIYYYTNETDEANNTATIVPANGTFTITTKAVTTANGTQYVAKTLSNALPYGQYSIQETKSNSDYELTDNTVYYFTIDENTTNSEYVSTFTLADGTEVNANNSYLEIKNRPYRGDISFIKLSEDFDKMSVPFVIQNLDSGEKHIIVTDEDGKFDSSTFAHNINTNANDKFIVNNVIPQFISKEDFVLNTGMWFGQNDTISNNSGAFAIGNYSYTEIRSEDNFGRELISGQFTVTKDGIILSTNDAIIPNTMLDNDTTPGISTVAIDENTRNHITYSNGQVVIQDTVSMNGLILGKTYTLIAAVMDYDTNDKAITNNKEVDVVEKTFIATDTNMQVTVNIPVDTTDTTDKTFVIFENLYKDSVKMTDITYELTADETEITGNALDAYVDLAITGKLVNYSKFVASHVDITDRNQTIELPGLKTEAFDSDTLSQMSRVSEETHITDIIKYTRLLPNQTYTVEGTVYIKETGKALTDKTGKPYTVSKEFTPTTSSGELEMNFTIDTKHLNGHTLVVGEVLIYKDIVLVNHTDMNDTAQSIYIPDLKTTLSDSKTLSHTGEVTTKVTLIDHVEYKNLTVGHKYVLEGVLMTKATNKEYVDANLNLVKNSIEFTPTTQNGTIDVKFEFDASNAQNLSVVAFEKLYDKTAGDVEIVSHEDINDEQQTVSFPKISTKAMDKNSNSQTGIATKTATIIDTVTYSNLIIGKEYRVDGVLMVKPNNANDEPQSLKDENGKPITASVTFTANSKNGKIDLVYNFDASLLEGATVVVYETLYHNDIEVYSHKDITDEDQSIYYPTIRTTITDKQTKTNVGRAVKELEVIDTVSYKNLIIGTEYVINGILIDKNTGKPVKDANNKEITASTKFIAKDTTGTVDVTFVFDGVYFEGKTLVAFEDLYVKDMKVATHNDINDEAQTIYVPKVRTTASDGETGIHSGTISTTATIKDIVKYENLKVGNTYKISGHLVNKETGEAILTNTGIKITAEKEFIANSPNGEVELIFNIDSTLLNSKAIVVFEDVYYNNILVATHSDINDVNQTINYPTITTTAIDSITKSHIGAVKDTVTIIDEVKYQSLVPNTEYVISGVLMNKSTGKEFLDGANKPVVATTTFIPTKPEGTIEIEYVIEKGNLEGVTIVVFENLYQNEKLVVAHNDINDEAQTVQFPSVKTMASDNETQTHTGRIGTDVVLIDVVEYNNLIVGKEYTINGTLMNKDKKEPVLNNNLPITATTTFKAEKSEGKFELEYKADTTALAGTTTVFFEDLVMDGNVIISHSDYNNADETIYFPAIKTVATVDGGKEVEVDSEIEIVDEVFLENLVVGETYTLYGRLMNQKDSKEISVTGATTDITFVATEKNMTVNMIFKINSSDVGDINIVVFETLYRENIKIAGHENINDKNQTIYLVNPPGEEVTKTGDSAPLGILFTVFALSGICITILVLKKKKQNIDVE